MNSSEALFFTELLAFFSIYSLGSLAGLLSEKSGIVNIALDGKMIMGGLIFTLFFQINGFEESLGWFSSYLALILAGLFSMLYATLLCFFTINLLSDHVITGTALNMIAPAFSLLVMFAIPNGGTTISDVGHSSSWSGNMDSFVIIMTIVTILILLFFTFFFHKTNYGLRLKASGENPYALETAGISVKKTRWFAVMTAGFLSGMAGAIFVANLDSFSGTVNGSGYLSLAILILGQWTIIGITSFSLLFSVLVAVVSEIDIGISSELAHTIPFILPLIVLVIFKAKSNGPSSAGKPFKKDMR